MNISKEFQTLHLDKDELFVYSSWRDESPYDLQSLSYGDLKQVKFPNDEKEDLWYMPNLMSGSDYSGDTVTRSNFLEMKSYVEMSKHIKEVYGGHGSYGIAFNVSKLKGKFALELVDIFKQLENYPLIDDEAMSNLEMELENEYWENDLKEEFCKQIEKSLQSIGFTVEVDRDSTWLWEAYRILMDKTNTYLVFETGCTVYLDVEELCSVENLECLVEPVEYHDDFKLDYILTADYTDLKKILKDPNAVEAFKEQERSYTEICDKYGIETYQELEHVMSLYEAIKEEWNRFSFDEKESLAQMTAESSLGTGKYYYLYSVLKEMEK